MSEIPDNAPSPRLCVITKWPDFEGYGFNLHAEKSKPGQFIGKVDAASPAEMAGLKEGDRIIEVNGVNISNENHKQVVQRIKAVPNETKLLVVDIETDKYFKNKNIVVKGTQSNVVVKTSNREVHQESSPKTEPAPPYTNGHHHHDEDNRSVSSAASSSAASEGSTLPQPAAIHEEASSESTTHTQPENSNEAKENENVETKGDSSSEEEVEGSKELPPPPPPPEGIEEDSRDLEVSHDDEVASLSSSSLPPGDIQDGKVEDTSATKEEVTAPLEASETKSNSDGELDSPVSESTAKPEAPKASNSRRSSSASSSNASEPSDTAHTENTSQSPMSTSPTPPPSLDNTINKSAPSPTPTPVPTNTTSSTTTTAATKNSPQPAAKNYNYNTGGLNLNMSAAEMRELLARKKKVDPRKETLDLRKKYEIIQNM